MIVFFAIEVSLTVDKQIVLSRLGTIFLTMILIACKIQYKRDRE